ncbi:MAG: helix-turn-helix transcriptional regulator [Candidatus Sumerlaeota bacterium]
MVRKNKDLCETHIIGEECREAFLPLGERACQPLAAADVSLAGLSHLAGQYCIGRICPNFHGVLVTLSGKGMLHTSQGSHILSRNSLAILPADISYLYELKSPGWDIAWFHLRRRKRWRGLEAQQASVREFAGGDEIANSMQAILRESHSGDVTAIRMVELHSELLTHILQRELTAHHCTLLVRYEEELKTLWREVAQNLSAPWTIREISRRLHVAPGHFHRIVQEVNDTTPMQILTKMRMDRAALLMRHSTLNVAQVAAAIGYSDAFAFSTAFKRHFGKSPSQFRSDALNPDASPSA